MLDGAESADVAIVGGGLSGVSTALHLALAGHQPILVEAGRIGSGATGASGGIVAPQLARHGFGAVSRKVGRAHAEQIVRLVAESGRYVFELAARYAPESEAVQAGFLAPAMSPAGSRRIRDIVADWAPFRKDVSLLDGDAFARLTGVCGYRGALLDSSGGTINPLGYVRGLAHAASEAGAQLFCQSPVVRIERSGASWVVRTSSGMVRARRVVLCANGGNAALHPSLYGTVLPMDVCEVSTVPLGAELRGELLPGRQAMTDVENDVFTIRYAADGGLVTAYPTGSPDRQRVTDAVNARLAAAIPHWQALPLNHVWTGTAWINTSLMPRLVQVDENLVAVQACNGRGLAFNSIIGRELARWLAAPPGTPPPLPLERPARVKGLFVARFAPQLVMRAGLLRKRLARLAGSRK